MTISRPSVVVRLIGLAALALCVTTPSALRLVAAVSAADKPRAERPVYKVGDKWIRTDGIYVLVRIDKDVYVFSAGGGKEFHLSKDLGITKIILEGRTELDLEPAPRLSWPLEVGKWGTTRLLWRSALPQPLPNFTGSVGLIWQVDAHEDVATPAGTFPAFRITQKIETVTGSQGGSGQQFGQVMLWYAPDVQRFVKAQGNLKGLNWELNRAATPTPPPVVATPAPQPAEPRPPAEPPRREPGKMTPTSFALVTGLVTDNVEVVRVQVLVNGVEAPSLLDVGVVGRGVPLGVLAELKPGPNVIEVVATDKAGNVAQAVRNVTRLTGASAPTPAGPKIANRWAVVIGVGDYESKSVPKLRFAEPDADAMYRLLTTRAGFPRENVVLLTDKAPEKPTLQNIRLALGDFLARKTTRDDLVLIYYAGLGAPEADTTSKEKDGLAKYLIPRNVQPESLRSTAFAMEEVQGILARIPAERVVLLLDTSYSGVAGGRSFAPSNARPRTLSDQFLDRLTKSRGRLVITASGPNEVALETAELGHGLFTYYLLEGLSGKADRNGDGVVTVSELYPYVEDQVERKSRAAGGRQRPLMKGEIEGTLPLSRLGR